MLLWGRKRLGVVMILKHWLIPSPLMYILNDEPRREPGNHSGRSRNVPGKLKKPNLPMHRLVAQWLIWMWSKGGLLHDIMISYVLQIPSGNHSWIYIMKRWFWIGSLLAHLFCMCTRVGFGDEQQLFSSPFFLQVLWFGWGLIYNMSHAEIQQGTTQRPSSIISFYIFPTHN